MVSNDPLERTGTRASLNYGHTLAHAVETAGRYDLNHGEAVAVGLVFAGHASRVRSSASHRHSSNATSSVVGGLGLPTSLPGDVATSAELLAVMRRDKKAHGGLTFVLPDAGGELTMVDDPPAPALEAAFRAVGVGG